jgi:hypothetical protein
MADGQEIEVDLRAAPDVGRRMVVLATLCRRAFLESDPGAFGAEEDAETERFDLVTWLQEHGLQSAATVSERRFLESPAGTLSADEVRAGTWHAEALIALGWAAGFVGNLPDPVVPADPTPILDAVPTPWDDPKRWVASVALRPEETIARERERAEIWLWRAEFEDERQRLRGLALSALEADLREVVRESAEVGFLSAVDADFPVAGRPFRLLDKETTDVVAAVAGVRLHALNWLCGYGTSWDDVPLDVG